MSASTNRASYSIAWAGAALGDPTADWDSVAFSTADTLEIASENFSWRKPGPECDHDDFPHPAVQARVVWDSSYLAVMFRVEDHFVQCKGTTFQDMVCLDSCCEFFIAPETTSSESSPYFNFEVSANGTMLVYFCQPEHGMQTPLPDFEWTRVKMAASLVDRVGEVVFPEITEPTTWHIEYHLPWSLFSKYFGKGPPTPGDGWSANFCKHNLPASSSSAQFCSAQCENTSLRP